MADNEKLPDIKVAALQFSTTTDVDENLATCLRVIDKAAREKPNLMVLGEFSNHLSWYDDADHAWDVALDLDGDFLGAIADRAKIHDSYIDINVSLRRAEQNITVTSLLYGPEGTLVAEADKQTLMGHENHFFKRAEKTSPIVETPFGNLALFPCRDGVTFETPRGLALRGAQLFCDSLNSFALDEESLHVPARAPENKCFLVSANKVGPLIPEPLLGSVSEATHIPIKYLMGAGGSQIVSPAGEILTAASSDQEEVIYATLNLSEADDKTRPDGTNIFSIRRPELYSDIAEFEVGPDMEPAVDQVDVALVVPDNLDDLAGCIYVLPANVQLVVLPALFANDECESPSDLVDVLCELVEEKELAICASIQSEDRHQVILVHKDGIEYQDQLHHSNRWQSKLGEDLNIIDISWGKVAMINSDDAAVPEIVKVAALRGVHTLIVPADFQENSETRFGLPSRAAENRICVVACGNRKHGGLVASLERDFTILTEWKERLFDGKINEPLVTPQDVSQKITIATIHPNAACNKLMSEKTDLLADRPRLLSHDIVDPKLVK